MLKAKVLEYHPDLVLLGFNLNDFIVKQETAFQRAKRLFGVDYIVNSDQTVTILLPPQTTFESNKTLLYQHFAFFRLLGDLKNGFIMNPLVLLNLEKVMKDKTSERIYGALQEFSKVLFELKIKFVVAIIPAMAHVNSAVVTHYDAYPYKNGHSEVHRFLESNGISYLDILSEFGSRETLKLAVSRFDPHFNQTGNAIIANALYEFLSKHGNLVSTGSG